ncbi:flagellar assembly protein FliW [Candidatus Haliotispira prima]|uniref:Flagellar assembly factor FliW n=1 Tax=Candidatus Haliotispira prima TaxID=3034016 RepID=A0ABY8MDY6_9SPIO|nr:flagellar assembly protein FliW [Candidatus Haliotispira prima]
MIIQTQAMGEVEIDLRQIFHFPYGLYAFEDLRSFALLDSTYPPFYWLQSMEHEELAFLLLAPQFLISDYSVKPAALEDFSGIGLQDESDANLLTFSIVTLNDRDSTANMKGPVVLNKVRNLGRQIIVSDEHRSVRHSLTDLRLPEPAVNFDPEGL